MRPKSLAPALFALSIALPAASSAQVLELWVGAGQSIISNGGIGSTTGTGPKDVELKDGFRINFRMALTQGDRFGHEIGYAYNRSQLRINTNQPPTEQGMAIHQGFYDFLAYATKEGQRVRPFVAGGVQFQNFVPPGSSASQGGGQTKFGINYGAGIKVRILPSWALRLDFRQYNTGKPFDLPGASGRFIMNEISAGVGFVM